MDYQHLEKTAMCYRCIYKERCKTVDQADDLGIQQSNWSCPKFTEENHQGSWILVSERLPIRNGIYNVTRIIEGTAISSACYFDGQNTWHHDTGVNHGRPYLNDIIAWQELPEPYEE